MPESLDRGALTEAVFYILLSLHKPTHGYAIMQEIERMTKGRVALGAGTLYGAINALERKRWIAAVPGSGRKKDYVITETGKAVYLAELDRLRALLQNDDDERKGANR
jgi:DNA-binding PadR family transcriptional regulator